MRGMRISPAAQAQAFKGAGELKQAARTLETLLALPGQAKHAEARKLHVAIREGLRDRAAQRSAWVESQQQSVKEQREKIEAEAAQRKEDEAQRKREQEERQRERDRELAEATQVRPLPKLGSRIEVYWEGDKACAFGLSKPLAPPSPPAQR